MAEIPAWDLEEVARREDAFVALVDKSIAMVVKKVSLISEAVLVAAAVEPVEAPPPPPPPVAPALPVEALGAIPVLWAGQVTAELLPFLGATFSLTAAAVAASITEAFPDYDFPPVSDAFAEEYLASASNRLVGIGDTIWANMRQELLVGFSEGESIAELAARLQAVAGITEPRAHVIARTEVISASNIGSITQAKISGLVGTKSWEATNDDRTRCTHRAADGQTVDLNGKFKLGGLGADLCNDAAASYLDVPGDPTGPPGEVIQCRCTIIYDLDLPEEEPVVTAAAQVHTGAMIAFRMTEPDARCLELNGFEDADELHTTSLYLGDAVNFSDEDREGILGLVAGIAGEYDPITTNTFALNIFNPHVPDPDTALVLGVEGGDSGLVELQQLITEVITSEYAIATQHKPWVPHITLAYSDDIMLAMKLADRLGPVTYDRIRVAFGGDVYDMPLGQVLTAADVNFDESKVKRDKKGKFAKKAGVPDSAGLAAVKSGDFSSLKRVGPQGGSNPGGIFEAPDGTRFYVKVQKSKAHGANERAAAVLYNEAGIDVPHVYEGKGIAEFGDGKFLTATELVDGAKSDLSSKLNDPAYVAKVREGFAVDAWLADWDAVGLNYDNIVTDKDGDPIRIDVGGSLKYRAQGAPKGDSFGDTVPEWKSMRSSKAPQASKLFKDATPEQLKASAERVKNISPERIKELVKDKALADKLIKRRADLIAQAEKEVGPLGGAPTAPTPSAPSAPSGPAVAKLTNAVIYGKYTEGEVIATSTDGKTRLKYSGNKINEYEKVGDDWKLVKSHTKGGAYKDVNSLGKSWYMGEGPAPAAAPTTPVTPSVPTAPVATNAPLAPGVSSPPVATVAVNLSPESLWANKDKWADGEVMMEATPLAGTVQPPFRFVAKKSPSGESHMQLEVKNTTDGTWANFGLLNGPDQIKSIKNSSANNFTFSLKAPKAAMTTPGPVSTTPDFNANPPMVFNITGTDHLYQLGAEGKIPDGTVVMNATFQTYTQPYQRVVWDKIPHTSDSAFNVQYFDHATGDWKYSHSLFSSQSIDTYEKDPLLKVTWSNQFDFVPAGSTSTTPAVVSLSPVQYATDAWDKRREYPDDMVLLEGLLPATPGSATLSKVRISTAKNQVDGSKIIVLQTEGSPGQWLTVSVLKDKYQAEDVLTDSAFNWKPVTPYPVNMGTSTAPAPTTPSPPSGPPGPPATGAPPATVTGVHKAKIKSTFSDNGVKWYTGSDKMLTGLKAAHDKFPQYTLYQLLDVMDKTTTTGTDPTPFTTKMKKYLATNKGAQHAKTLWGTAATFNAAKGTPSSSTNANTSTPSITSGTAPTYGPSAGKPATLADYPTLTPTEASAMGTSMKNKYGKWTPEQQKALYHYTGYAYGSMNGCLRKPSTCTASTIKYNNDAAAGMRPTTKAIKTFRGAGWSSFGLGLETSGLSEADRVKALQAKVGKTVTEPGFLSTSVLPGKAFSGPLRIEVHAPPGTPAAYVSGANSQHPNEKELLYAPGLEYRVVEVLPPNPSLGQYKTVVRLEVVVP